MKHNYFRAGGILLFCFVAPRFVCGQIKEVNELPIKPSRTISITTNEGSYMNVDISPDGKMILFDLLGELFIMPASGGAAKQLTRGLAVNRFPVWSRDGKYIAYVSDATGTCHIHIRDLSGKFHKVLDARGTELGDRYNARLVWLPDSKNVTDRQYIFGINGGKVKLPQNLGLGLNQFSSFEGIQFFSDAKYVAVAKKTEAFNTAPLSVIQIDRISGAALQSSIIPYGSNPLLSPDRRWLVYVRDSTRNLPGLKTLILRDVNSGLEKTLISTVYDHRGYVEIANKLHYAFSPDSKGVYMSYGGKLHHIDIGRLQDRVIPFTAKVKIDMGKFNYHQFKVDDDSLEVKYIRDVSIRPDGKQMVFSALNRIYVMNLPQGKPRILADQPFNQFEPSYSADGKSIAYVSWSDAFCGALWKIASGGGSPIKLSADTGKYYYQYPTWSPLGDSILMYRRNVFEKDISHITPSEAGLLYLVSSSRPGKGRIIAEDGYPDNKPAFGNDGKYVVYQILPPIRGLVNRGKLDSNIIIPQLLVKSREGSSVRILCTISYLKGYAKEMAFPKVEGLQISPDGRYIVYSIDEKLYLVPAIQLAGEATAVYAPRQDVPVICFANGIDAHWEKDGKLLCWTYANKFYSIRPDNIIEQSLHRGGKSQDHLPESNAVLFDVNPDQEIAITLKAPLSKGKGFIALKNARIISMKGNEVFEQGSLLIKDNRIVAIGTTKSVKIPEGTTVIDASGKTIIPGFIDMHDHYMSASQGPTSYHDCNINSQQLGRLLATFAYGTTTARNPSGGYQDFGYNELSETGQMIAPRIYSSGAAVYLAGDHPEEFFTSLEQAIWVARQRVAMGGTFTKQYMLPTRIQRQWLLLASSGAGLNMTNEGGKDPFESLAMIKDGTTMMEHYKYREESYTDILQFTKQTKTLLCPTLIANVSEAVSYFKYYYRQHPDNKISTYNSPIIGKYLLSAPPLKDSLTPDFLEDAQHLALLRHNGQRITVGGHGSSNGGIDTHFELWAMQMGGLTNLEVLQSATILGAEGIGVQKDLGSIELGKLADLLILDKNPLEDIHNSREIRYVMKNGILYDANTLDEIWPEKKKCPEWRIKAN